MEHFILVRISTSVPGINWKQVSKCICWFGLWTYSSEYSPILTDFIFGFSSQIGRFCEVRLFHCICFAHNWRFLLLQARSWPTTFRRNTTTVRNNYLLSIWCATFSSRVIRFYFVNYVLNSIEMSLDILHGIDFISISYESNWLKWNLFIFDLRNVLNIL